MTNGHLLVSEWITRLSFAAEAIDELAPRREVIGNVTLRLTGGIRERKVEQPGRSGYYVFHDVPDGAYELETEADYYVHEPVSLTLPRPDPNSLVVKLILKPKPSYPFPMGASLLRGRVVDGSSRPLANVSIKVLERTESTLTTAEGAFALYFKNIGPDTLPVKLRIKRERQRNKDVEARVTKAKVISLDKIEYR
jgi:hypothetical protein